MPEKQKDLIIENAKIIFRNFAGRQTRFNAAGDRSFCVVLEKELADTLKNLGWNIRTRENPQDPQEEVTYYMRVKVVYKNFPPRIFMISGDPAKSTLLDEESIGELDFAEIENVDLIINPHFWSMNGQTGYNGYVKKLYATLVADDFGGKYKGIVTGKVADPEEDNDPPF